MRVFARSKARRWHCGEARRGDNGATRRRDERGAEMVEFALVLPVFALLLFALVDFGMLFAGYTTMRGGVQSAARLASINQYSYTGSAPCSSTDPTAQMVCTTMAIIGALPSANTNTIEVGICFISSGDTCATSGTEGVSTTGNQCTTTGQYCDVEICAQATIRSVTGITSPFLNGKTLSSSSIVRLELGAISSLATSYHAYNSSTPTVSYNGQTVNGLNCP